MVQSEVIQAGGRQLRLKKESKPPILTFEGAIGIRHGKREKTILNGVAKKPAICH